MANNAGDGFFAGFNFENLTDNFSKLAGDYFKYRTTEKQAEALGSAQLGLVGAVEGVSAPNATPQPTQTATQTTASGFQIDQKTMIFAGVGLLAVLVILKK